MLRFTWFARSRILVSAVLPALSNNNPYDKTKESAVNAIKLDDKLGWDRVKKIFKKDEYGVLTKELQSIINVTISGFACGACLGGLRSTTTVISNFIESNEATRFDNHLHAKQVLHQRVIEKFIKYGGKLGIRLGFFCFMFSLLTTCTTAYRGKLKIENYVLGASVTGLLFRINMGIRGALVGAVLAAILGLICGTISVLVLKLAGVSMDTVLEEQQSWITSRDRKVEESIKKALVKEKPEIQQMVEEIEKLKMLQKKKNVEDTKT